MPARFRDYRIRDHLRLRPVIHRLKEHRYATIDHRFCRLPPHAGDLDVIRKAVSDKRILVTIAFNDPEILGWQMALVRHFVTADLHIVVDNSPDQSAVDQIAMVARKEGCPYLRLPPNPWTGRNASRSHGLALNWIWQNIIKPGAPKDFGFLDDDLLPVAPTDPFEPLDEHPFHGDLRWAGDRWFLWAGYCFYRYHAVASRSLDFGLDWFVGLDTGGANWQVLYRHVEPDRLPQRPIARLPALGDDCNEYFEKRGAWLHEVGQHGNPALRQRMRAAFKRLLAPSLIEAGAEADAT